MASSRLRLVLAIATALCLAAPLSASAATTRYASPTGTGASPCLATAPCSIETALSFAEGLASFDTVLLAPGTYEPTAELKVGNAFVTVEGEPGLPTPVIEAAPGERGLLFEHTGTLRDVRIHATSATHYALVAIGAESLVERVATTGDAAAACAFGSVTVRDTLCATSALSGEGLISSISGEAGTGLEPAFFNVTAIGGRMGIAAVANESSIVKITAVNTIARGGQADIGAISQNPPESHVEVLLAHSNFATVEKTVDAFVTSSSMNGNQEAAPVFADAAGGNYSEAPTSPTRLAGDLGVLLPGEVDLAGNPRTTNCAGTVGVDIGAYQYECPTPQPPVGPKDETKPEPQHPCTCVLELPPVPSLTKLGLKPARFVDAGKPPKGTARGTTISFTLSATASVRLEVLGKKTVKGKKPKTVLLGTLPPVAGKAGANHVKFSGKVDGKLLDPGVYTLRAVVTAAGRQSSPVTTSFTVLAPAIP